MKSKVISTIRMKLATRFTLKPCKLFKLSTTKLTAKLLTIALLFSFLPQTAFAAAPAAPTGVNASRVDATTALVTWTANTTGVDKFYIYKRQDSGAYVEVTNVSATTTSYQIGSLVSTSTYYFGVKAKNSAGEYSAQTNSGFFSSQIPTNVVATASASTCAITVSWTDNHPSDMQTKIFLKNSDGTYSDTGNYVGAGVGTRQKDITTVNSSPLTCDQSYTFAVVVVTISPSSVKVDSNTVTYTLDVPTLSISTANSGTTTATNTITITNPTSMAHTTSLEKQVSSFGWKEIASLSQATTSYTDSCYSNENCQYRARRLRNGAYTEYSTPPVSYNNPAGTTNMNPAWLGHVSLDQFPKDSNNGFPQIYGVYDVAVTDNYLYTASSGRLSIYSISNTRGQLPQYVSSIVGVTPYSVAASAIGGKEYAFITDGSTGILKVIDPILPAAVKTINLPGTCNHLNVVGSHAYVACGAAGIVIVDVSDPLNPIQRSVYDTDGTACSVDVEGALAAVADGTNGLVTLNISDPDHPAYLGRVDLPLYNGTGGGIDVDLAGSTAWVANAHSGLSQVNVSAPSQPSLIRTAPTSGLAAGVQVYGGYVFVAGNNGNSPRTGVNVFKINEMTAAPTFLSALGYSTHQVAVRNGTIYLTDNLNLVDVATFYDPTVDKELSLTKSVDNPTVAPGDTVTVTLTMKNVSPNAIHNLIVTDPILSQTSYKENSATIKIGAGTATQLTDIDDHTAAGGDTYTLANNIPTWNFSTMVPATVTGDTITLSYKVIVNANATPTEGVTQSSSASQLTPTESTTTEAVTETPATTPASEASNTNTGNTASTGSESSLPPVPGSPAEISGSASSSIDTSSSTNTSGSIDTLSQNANTNTQETAIPSTSTVTKTTTTQKQTNKFFRFFGNLWDRVKGVVGR